MTLPARRANPRQANGLREMVGYISLPPGAVGVEVGSFRGESAMIIAESGKFSRLTCVDIWQGVPPGTEQDFDQRTAGHPVIRKLRLPSVEAAKQFEDRSLDFVYIDARHDYKNVLADIRAWHPKVKIGGWITGHDYFWRFPGVLRAVYETLHVPTRVFQDTSWAKRVG